MRKNNLAYLLNEQCLCLWPSSVYWWATWIRGLHFVTKTWRYRLCKNKNKLEFTLYQDACIIISQTAWYIVVLIQWNTFFKERFPAYANIKKTLLFGLHYYFGFIVWTLLYPESVTSILIDISAFPNDIYPFYNLLLFPSNYPPPPSILTTEKITNSQIHVAWWFDIISQLSLCNLSVNTKLLRCDLRKFRIFFFFKIRNVQKI